MKNLNEMTSKELKEIGKNLHISGWWKMKKEDLIAAISSMTEKEKNEAKKEEEIEKQLFDHYQKNWSKYGPKNDWVKFLEKYKKGKIDLIEDTSLPVELEETETFEPENDPEIKPKTKSSKNKLRPEKGAQIEYNGKSQNICAWARELGISPNTLYGRIYKMGWSIEKAFTTPSRRRNKK